jgi:2-polyprenyl-3-methyl-5-hydroxy-6-metoxy-1,4-benzoquinol methylase
MDFPSRSLQSALMHRQPEPELMDQPNEALAYAAADFASVNAAFVDRLLDLTWPLADSAARCVDLGTGPGDIPIRVARARPQWHVDAVDAADAMIDLAHAAVASAGVRNVRVHHADVKGTRLAAGYDVIFSNSLLHHLPDPEPMWREIRRLARPGAVVLVRDLLRPQTYDLAEEMVEQYAGRESATLQQEYLRSLLSAFTPAEIRSQLESAGLGALEIRQSTDRHIDVSGVLT